MPPYERAVFPMPGYAEPHDAPPAALADLAWRIVECEGPIHVDELARRLAACFNKDKAGVRILAATRAALAAAGALHADLLSEDDFFYTTMQAAAAPVRDRSAESGATLKAKYIAPLEIKAALRLAREHNADGSDADAIRTAANLLGFRRVGPDLQERIAMVNSALAAAAQETPLIHGPGTFAVPVRLSRMVPPELAALPSPACRLLLRAGGIVAVEVEAIVIGNLPEQVGQEFCAAVVAGGLLDYRTFACAGRFMPDAEGDPALWLDLPED
jgi:hypothetical protein